MLSHWLETLQTRFSGPRDAQAEPLVVKPANAFVMAAELRDGVTPVDNWSSRMSGSEPYGILATRPGEEKSFASLIRKMPSSLAKKLQYKQLLIAAPGMNELHVPRTLAALSPLFSRMADVLSQDGQLSNCYVGIMPQITSDTRISWHADTMRRFILTDGPSTAVLLHEPDSQWIKDKAMGRWPTPEYRNGRGEVEGVGTDHLSPPSGAFSPLQGSLIYFNGAMIHSPPFWPEQSRFRDKQLIVNVFHSPDKTRWSLNTVSSPEVADRVRALSPAARPSVL